MFVAQCDLQDLNSSTSASESLEQRCTFQVPLAVIETTQTNRCNAPWLRSVIFEVLSGRNYLSSLFLLQLDPHLRRFGFFALTDEPACADSLRRRIPIIRKLKNNAGTMSAPIRLSYSLLNWLERLMVVSHYHGISLFMSIIIASRQHQYEIHVKIDAPIRSVGDNLDRFSTSASPPNAPSASCKSQLDQVKVQS